MLIHKAKALAYAKGKNISNLLNLKALFSYKGYNIRHKIRHLSTLIHKQA